MPRTLAGESRTDVYNMLALSKTLTESLEHFTRNQGDSGALAQARIAAEHLALQIRTLRALAFTSSEGE